MLSTLEPLDTRHLLLPVSFVSRLITTAQEAFAVQFVQVRAGQNLRRSTVEAQPQSYTSRLQLLPTASTVRVCWEVGQHRMQLQKAFEVQLRARGMSWLGV